MSSSNSDNSSGIGFVGLLTIVFVTLKLCDVIAWSWWWVLSPIWISAAVMAIVLFCFVAAAGAVWVFFTTAEWWKSRS